MKCIAVVKLGIDDGVGCSKIKIWTEGEKFTNK